MTVFAEFFKHSNFGGAVETFTLSNSWRYRWIKFGGTLKNEISSMRAKAYSGHGGNVYGFSKNNFLGDFAALNMANNWTCWWSYVGGSINDDIESALMIRRSQNEYAVDVKDKISEPFKTNFDAAISGTQVKRNGDPKIYAVFWPSWASSKKFVCIEQKMTVELDWWWDYEASVKYYVYFYINASGQLKGYVYDVDVWVEGGIFSSDIRSELEPKLEDGADKIDDELTAQLDQINALASLFGMNLSSVYLIPGNPPNMPPPSSNFGRKASAYENATLVVTY